jgi:hypothetical protein
MDKQRLWGIPSWTVLIAFGVTGVFLYIAYCLYGASFGGTTSTSAYSLKVADALINGAIVGIFVAAVKAIFELPKWLRGL